MGRINILVGKNNAGKTCLLEALHVLASGNPVTLGDALYARNEAIRMDTADRRFLEVAPDVRCAFFERASSVGSSFEMECKGDVPAEERRLSVTRIEHEALPEEEDSSGDALARAADGATVIVAEATTFGRVTTEALRWKFEAGGKQDQLDVPLFPDGGMSSPRRRRRTPEALPVRLVRTDLGTREQVAHLWGPIAATENEENVVALLKIVEADIERIAAAPGSLGGIFVRLRGKKERIPLGNFGDGTTRLFSLACNLIAAQHGLFLIDEIDTGLHVSTMVAMWRFLARAVQQFNVQIFATTHSDDCLRGLADFLRDNPDTDGMTRLFRIERGAKTAMAYTSEQIVRTSDSNVEVR